MTVLGRLTHRTFPAGRTRSAQDVHPLRILSKLASATLTCVTLNTDAQSCSHMILHISHGSALVPCKATRSLAYSLRSIGTALPLPERTSGPAIGRSNLTLACGKSLLMAVLTAGLVSASSAYGQQISDDPADAPTTTSLSFNTNAGLANTLTASCTTGSLNPSSGDFSLSSTPTSTSLAITAPAPCGNYYALPPAVPNAARDAWFRIDPPATAHRFRITLIPGSVSPLVNGAMAIYEAPSAAGPFRLIECATGGSSITGSANQPALEATCLTPGHKLYLRVWDEATPASTLNFKLCVQGQQEATMPARGATETPCAANLLNPSATYSNVDYVFSCNESPWLFADSGQYVGGDLWMRLTVPASGSVGILLARGTAAFANNIGVTAYLASSCGDPTTYRQVGNFSGTLPTVAPSLPNFSVSCLPAGATLYLRIHSIRQAQSATSRYGRIRIRWTAGPVTGTPPANNQPCGATPLIFGASCPIATGPGGNFDACNTPGIPPPPCGTFDGNTRDVWHSFVAPASGIVHIEGTTVSSGFPGDPALALYTTGGNGCSGRFTLIQCDSRSGAGNNAKIIRSGLVPGQVYYVRSWAEGSGAQGSYSLCITEPVAPAGTCFYLISLTISFGGGTQFMDVTIDSGATVTYATSGEPNEVFLITVPTGATAFFEYYNSGTSWAATRQVYRLGDPTPLWTTTSGGPVAGPTPPPEFTFTMTNACQPLTPSLADCLGSETVCTPNTEFGNLFGSLPPGNNYDLNATNMGCLNAENSGIAWLIFRPVADGTVAFWFDGTTNAPTTDLDFAIWDAGLVVYTPALPNISGSICAPNAEPLRCSSARRNHSTGLLPGLEGVFTEGPGGWGWLSPLPVLQDHVYLIAVVRGAGPVANVQYQMRWTLHTDASGVTSNTMLSCTPMVLPVELLFLEAAPMHDAVLLQWATASEKNSAGFLVEKSTNGEDFRAIGSVLSAGNTMHRTDYSFVDEDPAEGANYYRLRQFDEDGSASLSNVVVAVFNGGQGTLSIYPNPARDAVHLTMPQQENEGTMDVRVLDALGRIVHEARIASDGDTPQIIHVGALPSGVYVLSVTDERGASQGSGRFVKQ